MFKNYSENIVYKFAIIIKSIILSFVLYRCVKFSKMTVEHWCLSLKKGLINTDDYGEKTAFIVQLNTKKRPGNFQ